MRPVFPCFNAYRPQLPTMQPTAARSPTLNLPTDEPIWETIKGQ